LAEETCASEAAALLVLCTVIFGSLITYLIVPQPRANGNGTERSGWSAVLGFFASLPVAYIALVIESHVPEAALCAALADRYG